MRTPVLVIGAGPTGLAAGHHLGADALIVDRNETVGGWCRSVVEDGFTFDYAGHIMFSNDPWVHEMYAKLLGDNVHWQDREAWIYSKGVHTRYPFQGALYGLPPEVIKECLVGAIEARFGPLKAEANGAAKGGVNGSTKHTNGAHAVNGGQAAGGACEPIQRLEDCCADGVMEAEVPLVAAAPAGAGNAGQPAVRDFESFIYDVWGAGIAKHFAIPYNRKLWAVPLHTMETSWLGGRVPLPDLGEMIEGALRPVPKPMGPNARFGYPLRGGFQALMNGFLPLLESRLRLGSSVVALSPRRRTATLDDGTSIDWEQVVSTAPLPELVRMLGDEAPPEVRAEAEGLRHVSVRCVHLGVAREHLTEKHWIYYPEDPVFHRIFVQGNASPHCNPPGGFGLTCEITYGPGKPLPQEGDALVRRCIDDCIRVGMLREDDRILVGAQTDLPYAYVVYDHSRAGRVARLREWLLERGIVLAGRYGEWEYYNSDHAFIAGRQAGEAVGRLRGLTTETTRPQP